MVGAWVLLLAAIGVEVGLDGRAAAHARLPRPAVDRAGARRLRRCRSGCCAVVIRHIPVSVTYAVWSGLGTAGIALVGVLLLGERLGPGQGRSRC